MTNFKKFLHCIFAWLFSLFSIICKSQSPGDYRSNALFMDWNTAGSWQTWDQASSSWITASVAPDFNNAIINIQQGHTVLLSTPLHIDQLVINGTLKNTGAELTINDGPGDDLLIQANGKFINEGGNASVISFGKIIMNDSIINKVSCTFINKGELVNAGAYFKNTGKLINDVNSKIINSGDFLPGGTITFEKGSWYQHHFPSTLATAGTIPTASWKEGSTCEILDCGNAFQPGALNQVFHHFIWNNSTQPHDFNLIANPNRVNGNFEIRNTNNKKLAFKGASTGDLSVADSFKLSGGIFVLTNGSASTLVNTATYYQQGGTLDMSSSAAACTLAVTTSFTHVNGNIQRSGSAAGNAIIMNGNTASTIESIGFQPGNTIAFNISKEGESGNCVVPVNKTFTLHAGTTFSLSDNPSISKDLQVDGIFNAITNTWNLKQGSTIVEGTFINNSILPVAVNSAATTLLFEANSVYLHTGDGGEVVSALWSPLSTLRVTGIEQAALLQNGAQHFGNIYWDCKKQNQSCVFGTTGFRVLGNFDIESTGEENLRFPDCDFTIEGDLMVLNDAKLQLATAGGLYAPLQRIISINGTVSILHTATLQVGNPDVSASATVATNQYRDYYLELKKDFIYSSTTPLTSYHHRNYPGADNDEMYCMYLLFNGNTLQHLVIKKQVPGLVQVSPTECTSTNFYGIRISGRGTHLVPQLYDVIVHDIQVDAEDTLTIGLEDIHLVQYPVLNFTGTLAASSCNVNGVFDLGMNTLSDNSTAGLFQLNAGSTLITKHPQGIENTAIAGSIQNTGARIFDPGAHYIYNGNVPQVTGAGLPTYISGSLTIDNLTLPSTGGITLTQNTVIDGTLNLKKGTLLTAVNHLLTIRSNGTITPAGGQSSSFIDGPVKKLGLAAGTEFMFPTGNKTKWARIGIFSKVPSTAEFTATYENANPNKISTNLLGLDHISTKEYWKLNQTSNNSNTIVRLYWESGSHSGIYSINPADLKIAHHDSIAASGSNWKSEEDELVINGNPNKGDIQATASLSISNLFTFGSGTSINPLPVKLLSFTGGNTSKGNVLNWTTASEKDNHSFTVQRSINGTQFLPIGMVNGHGNSSNLLHYAYIDSLVPASILYYRLKQTDNDGKYTYSPIIRIEAPDREVREVFAYPNPASTDEIHILTGSTIQSFCIYNLLGKSVYEGNPTAENTEHVFIPNASGIYFIKAIAVDGKVITKRLIKN